VRRIWAFQRSHSRTYDNQRSSLGLNQSWADMFLSPQSAIFSPRLPISYKGCKKAPSRPTDTHFAVRGIFNKTAKAKFSLLSSTIGELIWPAYTLGWWLGKVLVCVGKPPIQYGFDSFLSVSVSRPRFQFAHRYQRNGGFLPENLLNFLSCFNQSHSLLRGFSAA